MDDTDTSRDPKIALDIAAAVGRAKSLLQQLEFAGSDLIRTLERTDDLVHGGLDGWQALTEFHPFAKLGAARQIMDREVTDDPARGTKVRFSEPATDEPLAKPAIAGKDHKINARSQANPSASDAPDDSTKRSPVSKQSLERTTDAAVEKSFGQRLRTDTTSSRPDAENSESDKKARDTSVLRTATKNTDAKKNLVATRRRDQRALSKFSGKVTDRSVKSPSHRSAIVEPREDRAPAPFDSVLGELTRELAVKGAARVAGNAPRNAAQTLPAPNAQLKSAVSSINNSAASMPTAVNIPVVEGEIETDPRNPVTTIRRSPIAPERFGQTLFDFGYRHGVDLT